MSENFENQINDILSGEEQVAIWLDEYKSAPDEATKKHLLRRSFET